MAYEPMAGLSPEQRQVHIETLVGDLRQRLYGNGQPGDIETMEARITKLESWFWRAVGAGGVLLFILQRVWK